MILDQFFPQSVMGRSRIKGAILSVVLLAATSSSIAGDFNYIVQPGDNPWSITQRYLRSIDYWPRIQAYNRITEPRAIPPGSQLRIPFAWMRGDAVNARVVDVRGDVSRSDNGATQPVSPGMLIGAGTTIQTAENGSLTLEFADGSSTLISGASVLHIRELLQLKASGTHRTSLELEHGQVENKVTHSPLGGGRYRIETPAAVAAVRGTSFRVSTEGGQMRTETLDGQVAVGNQRGETRLVAGTGTRVTRGERPPRASALLPTPVLDSLPTHIDRLPARLPLPPLADAQAYRSQVAPENGFTVIAAESLASTPEVRLGADLPDGHYIVRVRGIDQLGLGGLDAEHRFEIDARPEPPFPLRPTPAAVEVDEHIVFDWAQVADAQRYQFQLAADIAFENLLFVRDDLASPALKLDQALPPGEYYWRVGVTTPEGRGPYSDPQTFRRPPPGPFAEPPEIDNQRLRLRWRAGTEQDHYEIQFSRNPAFDAPEHAYRSEGAQLEIETPPSGPWFIRIRTLEGGTTPGPWGKAQQIEVPYNHWPAIWVLLPLLLVL